MNQNAPIRPQLLTLLCILTFFGSGMLSFVNITMFGLYDSFLQAYQQGAFEAFVLNKEQEEVINLLFAVTPTYYLSQGITYGISLIGAILMWNFKKLGFHLYAIAQIIVLILQQIYLPSLPFPTMELLVTTLFIVLYARHLKFMYS